MTDASDFSVYLRENLITLLYLLQNSDWDEGGDAFAKIEQQMDWAVSHFATIKKMVRQRENWLCAVKDSVRTGKVE